MSGLRETYQKRLENLSLAISLQKRRLQLSSISRISIFIAVSWLVYMAFADSSYYAFPAMLLLVLFAYLVSRHQDLKYEFHRLSEMAELNRTELRVLEGQFGDLPDGSEFRQPDHPFSGDLDLFGPHSFFQYLNRTGLDFGAHNLADLLRSNQTSDIPDRQEAIRELAPKLEWRQGFTATARIIKTPVSTEELTGWMQGYMARIPAWVRYMAPFYSFVSLAVGLGVILGSIPVEVLVILFFGGLLITLFYSKYVSRLGAVTGKMQETFRQYQRLVASLEDQSFQSSYLQEMQNGLIRDGNKASEILKRLNRLIGALDQRNNLLVALFGNAFFLWDLRQAYGIEKWIAAHGKEVGGWFSVLGQMDAYISLANFAFNHPGYVYPVLTEDEGLVMEARQLKHPLIFEDVVPNDFRIGKGHFIVITGANMAGKSTFLRSVALAIVMANTGLPVSAASMVYKPIPLISSMRTSDSLSRHESYFFAELKRLKMIVDHLADGPYFVLLDEILKGTNSKDKAKGSREFLERLLSMQATGLIATHDLSLCEVADQLETVHNYFFDAHIREGELFFDYQFRPGVCSNMNASFLLRKLGVVQEGS